WANVAFRCIGRVLLGLAPPASLTAESSIQLNEILSPNPFYWPLDVLMLKVSGTRDYNQMSLPKLVAMPMSYSVQANQFSSRGNVGRVDKIMVLYHSEIDVVA
ncbi:hypothetical protein C5167_046161, partial [Papaver somniferum]